MNLGDPVLELRFLDILRELAVPENSFEGDKLPLEGPGELREISPGKDAVPFGAGLVVALVVLPVLLGCDVEDDVFAVI